MTTTDPGCAKRDLTVTMTFVAHDVPVDIAAHHLVEYVSAVVENRDPDLHEDTYDAIVQTDAKVISLPHTPLRLILNELPRAEQLHPTFATTLDAAMTALVGETGEVANAIQRESLERIIIEVAQVGCVSVRFLGMLLAMQQTEQVA